MSRWTFDKGQLNRQEWVSVGVGPAHLLVDMGQNMSYSANYADGSWDAVGMEGGRLVKTSYKEQFGKGCRNQTSHPHNTVRYIIYILMLYPKVDLELDIICRHYLLLLNFFHTPTKCYTQPRLIKLLTICFCNIKS